MLIMVESLVDYLNAMYKYYNYYSLVYKHSL
jgi:hypothetical protein